MKILLSPAKRMAASSASYSMVGVPTQALFQKEIAQVLAPLRALSPRELAPLMDISPRIAEQSWQYHQEIVLPLNEKNAKEALFAYRGDVYDGLDADTLSSEEVLWLQDRLRILSGLYGIVRPLDLIAPYRLEMGTKLSVAGKATLYEFWEEKLTQALKNELEKYEPVVNLASNQYTKVINRKKLPVPVVDITFKNWKGDTLKTIVLYTKRARGLMVRYIAQERVTTLEQLKGFQKGGYHFSEELSHENKLVFVGG